MHNLWALTAGLPPSLKRSSFTHDAKYSECNPTEQRAKFKLQLLSLARNWRHTEIPKGEVCGTFLS